MLFAHVFIKFLNSLIKLMITFKLFPLGLSKWLSLDTTSVGLVGLMKDTVFAIDVVLFL